MPGWKDGGSFSCVSLFSLFVVGTEESEEAESEEGTGFLLISKAALVCVSFFSFPELLGIGRGVMDPSYLRSSRRSLTRL